MATATPKTEKPLPTADLAQAVELIQRTAAAGVPAQIVEVKARDGAGDSPSLPVLITRDEEGHAEAVVLPFEELDAIARRRRLAEERGPDQREGTARLQSLESFIAHLNRFKDAHSATWADATARVLVSVIDYHEKTAAGAARWGKHRGCYQCPLSEAWLAWGGEKGLVLSQEGFAALLDKRDRELVAGTFAEGAQKGKPAPSPADLVTLANGLETFSTSTAKRERDPSGRVKLSFTQDSGIAGTVMPPAAFLINIRVFEDAAAEELEVRLRVTVDGNQARFHVSIHAAAEVLRKSFGLVCAGVKEQTELPVFVGIPEA
jgi:hypothetical protein